MLDYDNEISFLEVGTTGYKIFGSITGIGKIGPKHYGVILGEHPIDGKIYIAESMHNQYRLVTCENFRSRYNQNGQVTIVENDGKLSNVTVARRALSEIIRGGEGVYNLITNNCESFANRAMYGHSTSKQVVNTAIGLTAVVGLIWIAKKARSANMRVENA